MAGINFTVLGKREPVFTLPLSLAYKIYQIVSLPCLKFFHGFPFPSECKPMWAVPGHPPASSHATPSQAPCPPISPTSQAFIWHRTFAYDIFSAQNTLLLVLHMTGCFSPDSPEITLSWERPSWSPSWLIYSGYSVLFANFNMWVSCTKFLVYSSEFFLDFVLVHLPPLYYRISERSDHFFLVYIWISSPGT